MSEGLWIAIITAVGAILAGAITAYFTYRASQKKDSEKIARSSPQIASWRATDLKHKVGRVYKQHEWQATVPDYEDHLVYGQYITLSQGEYTALFRLKMDGDIPPNAEVALLDVVCNYHGEDAGRIIAEKSIARGDFP